MGGVRELLRPFVLWARREIAHRITAPATAASALPRKLIEQEEDLVRTLCAVAYPTLQLELSIRLISDGVAGQGRTQRQNAFVADHLANPAALRRLFLRYPPLARLLATICIDRTDVMCAGARDAAPTPESPDAAREIQHLLRGMHGRGDEPRDPDWWLGAMLPIWWMFRARNLAGRTRMGAHGPTCVEFEIGVDRRVDGMRDGESPASRAIRLSVLESGVLATSSSPPDQEARVPCAEAVLAGLRDTVRILAQSTSDLLDRHGPMQRLRRCTFPVSLRPAGYYEAVQGVACHPDYLRDALARDRLIATRLSAGVRLEARAFSVLKAEHDHLIAHHTPTFGARLGSRTLWLGDGRPCASGFFPATPWAAVAARIHRVDGTFAERQEQLVRYALRASEPPGPPEANVDSLDPVVEETERLPSYTDEALALGCAVRDQAVRHRHVADWFGIIRGIGAHLSLAALGSDLYSGAAGTAMFLAQLAVACPRQGFEETVWAAIGHCRHILRHRVSAGGAMAGDGSIAFAFLHVGAALGRVDLIEEAGQILVTRSEDAQRAASLDIIDGAAGFLTVLLAAGTVTNSTVLIERAIALGDRLIAEHLQPPRGWAWPSAMPSAAPLTGFSHGAAGIALALLRLGQAVGEARFLAAGRQGIDYERSMMDQTRHDWPELRESGDRTRFPHAWCHGGPGSCLARVSAPLETIQESDRHEIEMLLAAWARRPLKTHDSLCHGELGNLDVFVCAASQLQDPDLLRVAHRRARSALARRVARGYWRAGRVPDPKCGGPGLMEGTAGIGYELLRLASPDRVPSILALSTPSVTAA